MGDAVSWVPLGWAERTGWSWGEAHYEGTFNGNGHTIRIHIKDVTDNYQGLFSGIASNGRVENVHVVADIHCSSSRLVGGIAGENDGTIENCWVSGNVSSDWKSGSHGQGGWHRRREQRHDSVLLHGRRRDQRRRRCGRTGGLQRRNPQSLHLLRHTPQLPRPS